MGTSRTSRSGGRRSARSAPRANGTGNASQHTTAPAPGTLAAQAPHLVPQLSDESKAQAERDAKGITRAGYVRRDLAVTSTFNDVTYQAGANREVPQAFADHLDLANIAPDASTEANRKSFASGIGKENDQAEQGKAIKAAREAAPAAQRKHQQSDAFQATASPKKSSGKK